MKNLKKGFTLIELLIVIALLGTLAVALLAALDPLEQIKKGNDTGTRNTVSEIQAAFTRYYAIKGGVMPWGQTGTVTWGIIGSTAGSPGYSYLSSVIQSGELKSDFATLAGNALDKISITGYSTSNDAKVVVCYQPSSKSFQTDPNTKYGAGGASGTIGTIAGCGTAGSTCYWCVQ